VSDAEDLPVGGSAAGNGPGEAEPTDAADEAMVVVAIDADVCVGIGQCELLEPDVFALDDDLGYSAVIGTGRLPRGRAEVVVDKCPSNAIRIVEDGAS
jgi:ferredoxin